VKLVGVSYVMYDVYSSYVLLLASVITCKNNTRSIKCQRAHKFSKFLPFSTSALPGKELKYVFPFQKCPLTTYHRVARELRVVHSCQQKSIGLKFSKSQTGNDVRYSSHHNSSRFAFPIFAHSYRFSVLHSLQSITPRIY